MLRRTLPKVQDLLQEGQTIQNQAFHCKFEFPYIEKRPTIGAIVYSP